MLLGKILFYDKNYARCPSTQIRLNLSKYFSYALGKYNIVLQGVPRKLNVHKNDP